MWRSVRCMAVGLAGLAATAWGQEEPRAVQEIRRELASLPTYTVFDLVSFEYLKGTVVLGGYVTEPSLKRAAENAVKRVEGVEQVVNQIESLPNSISDDALRSELYRAIYRDSPLSRYGTADDSLTASRPRAHPWGRVADRPFSGMEPIGPHAIHVIVNRGNVMLAGVVDRLEDKQLAELKAKGVFGVRKVDNHVEVAGRAN